MAPVPQFTRVFVYMNEFSSGRKSENQVIVSRVSYTDVGTFVGFMELFANESSLSREHENLTPQGEFPDCHLFVKLSF